MARSPAVVIPEVAQCEEGGAVVEEAGEQPLSCPVARGGVSFSSTAANTCAEHGGSSQELDLEQCRLSESSGKHSARKGPLACDEICSSTCSSTDAWSQGDLCAREKSIRQRKMCCWGSCCTLVCAVLVLSGLLLWPKDPTWTVAELKFSKDDISSMIQAFTNPTFNDTVVFSCNARVDFENENYVGAEVGEGHFDVFFRGLQLAHATTEAMTVPSRDGAVAKTVSQVTITPAVSKAVLPVVMPSFKMTVDVKGSLQARALGILRLTIRVSCAVHLNVLAVVNNPNDMVTGQDCRYGL